METASAVTIDALLADGMVAIPLDTPLQHAMNAVFDSGCAFFRQAGAEKAPNVLPQDGGYRPLGAEYSRTPEHPDLMETFTSSDRTRLLTERLPNEGARRLHDDMVAAFDCLEPVVEELAIALGERLSGRPLRHALRGSFRRWSRLQLNYSRPSNTVGTFINELHEDGVLITLAFATGPGLEVQTSAGGFMPTTVPPSHMLVMPGEIICLLSGGRLLPLYHQVRTMPECSERLALLFFGDLDPDRCEPWVRNSVNWGVDIGARVRASASRFGLQGFTQD